MRLGGKLKLATTKRKNKLCKTFAGSWGPEMRLYVLKN
jgi:hypothetical protein